MQVKSIAECSAVLLTVIKLPIVNKIFVLSIFEWPFITGFTVQPLIAINNFSKILHGNVRGYYKLGFFYVILPHKLSALDNIKAYLSDICNVHTVKPVSFVLKTNFGLFESVRFTQVLLYS